ncbi:hypothetical protein [Nibricoccus sp. IMCC34717]|uniref:hypothetical protein n=1 Tax=Nibricoccus sp. IMCC34717 TaxID=3034021 RepID=UPI00384AE1A1
MGTQEFYIRAPAETESHGPYTLEQLVSLAEAGRIDSTTLYYDATTESWMVVVHNPHLKALLFPEKKRLSLRPKDTIAPMEPDTTPKEERVTVEEMLAAAEGATDETKEHRDRSGDLERGAQIGRIAALAMLLISAGALTLPSAELITSFDIKGLLARPAALLGLVDLGLSLVLLLGSTEIYPIVRFRAAIGVGYFGVLGWLESNYDLSFTVLVGAIGLFLTTVFLRYLPLALSIVLGLAGMGAFAYLSLHS